MSLKVCLAASIKHKSNSGGAAWLYLTWALGLRALGCQVIWLEVVDPNLPKNELQAYLAILRHCLQPYELSDHIALCSWDGTALPWDMSGLYLPLEAVIAEADLFLNLGYFPHPDIVRFRRSVFADTDPGLMQLWLSSGQLQFPRHDLYFSIGETVGTPQARFPDCGVPWHYTPPPVFLPAWPLTPGDLSAPITTVSNWRGTDWIKFAGELVSNEKRTAFMDYLELPSHTPVPLELALTLTPEDDQDRRLLEQHGWRVRSLMELNWTPEAYHTYVRHSRGEFSCAKPFYVRLETVVVHDRTLHYLASGKPAIVQHTGPSKFLPQAEGLFRFRNLHEAVQALHAVAADYDRHSRLARSLAEEYFDSQKVLKRVLELALA
jgi:hypothetical protein